jgi:hypothetical protein
VIWRKGKPVGVERTGVPAEPSGALLDEQRIARVDGQLAGLVLSGRRRGPAVDRLLDFRNAISPPRPRTAGEELG